MKKISLNVFKLYMVLSILVLNSCVYYNTLTLSEHSKNAIEVTNEFKNKVILSDVAGATQYSLFSINITDSTISGYLSEEKTHHPPGANNLSEKKARDAHIYPLQTMHIYLEDASELKGGKFSSSLENIHSIEIHETATGKSVMVPVSIALLVPAAIIGTIIATSDCACPFVESYNQESSFFHGSLFPGAIFKSQERNDYLELKDPILVNDSSLNLRIFNAMPEIEYIDQLEILKVEPKHYNNIAVLKDGTFVGFDKTSAPELAFSGDSIDVTTLLSEDDGNVYNFNNLNQTTEFNSVELSFPKENTTQNPKLVIVGKQSRWLENVANYLFTNIGNRYAEWVSVKDSEPSEKWTNKQQERGVSLGVYMKEDNKWRLIEYIDNAGTLVNRNFILELDLTNHMSPDIEIKIESAYRLWEIDQVAISDTYEAGLVTEKLEIISAINQNSASILHSLSYKDETYYVQREGESFSLEVGSLTPHDIIFLKSKGYYHHSIKNPNAPNYRFLKTMKQKYAFHELSRALDFASKLYAKNEETTSGLQ